MNFGGGIFLHVRDSKMTKNLRKNTTHPSILLIPIKIMYISKIRRIYLE